MLQEIQPFNQISREIQMQELQESGAEDKFEPAPEVEQIARQLIAQYHNHLINANIRYLFRLYTGMTRAKKRLVLVGDERAVKRAVHNNKIEVRRSKLAERIRGEGS